jgi:hypothetical protein
LWQEKFLRAAHLALRFFPPKLMDETKFSPEKSFPQSGDGDFYPDFKCDAFSLLRKWKPVGGPKTESRKEKLISQC